MIVPVRASLFRYLKHIAMAESSSHTVLYAVCKRDMERHYSHDREGHYKQRHDAPATLHIHAPRFVVPEVLHRHISI
jgi:hypothetical protein